MKGRMLFLAAVAAMLTPFAAMIILNAEDPVFSAAVYRGDETLVFHMYAGGRLDFVAGRMADPGGGELAFDEVYVRRTATVSGSEKQEMLETVESLAGAAAGHGPAPTGMTGRVECVVFYSGYVYRSEPDIRPLSGGNEQPDGLYSPIDRLVRQCERVFQYNIDFGEFHLFNEEARKKSLLYYEMKLFGVLGWLDE